MLPFMMLELCVYGLAAGLLRNVKLPVVMKVLFAQIAGRIIKASAIFLVIFFSWVKYIFFESCCVIVLPPSTYFIALMIIE